MRKSLTVLIGLCFFGISSPAFAECVCTTPLAGSSATIGSILSSSGRTLYSGSSGFVDATPGAKLVRGSQISTGNGASASISVGTSCNVNIPENSEMTLIPIQGTANICVNLERQVATAAPPISLVVPIVVITGAAGIALAVGGGDKAASN